MASEWPRVRISEVCELIVDCVNKTAPKSEFPTEFKMLRTPNVKNGRVDTSNCFYVTEDTYLKWTRRATVNKNDVLLTREAPLGEVGIVKSEEKLFLGQRLMQYRADQTKLDPDFLVYSFLSPDLQHQFRMHEGSGSVVSHIRVGDCSKFEINLPPLTTQKSIAKILGELDQRIELNRKTNQTLEQMAQALFKSWFIDFDPVVDNALAAGNPIPDELAHRVKVRKKAHALADFQLLPEHIRNLFPSEFEQTGEPTVGIYGWVPKGWHVSTTNDEFVIRGGSTPSTKNQDFWDGDIYWTSPKDLSGNDSKVLLDTSRKITDAGLAKITSGLLPLNTVLMSSRAPVGYLALAKVPVAINQGYIALLCEKNLTPEYTLLFLDSIMEEIKGISGGTTFAEISKKTFKGIKLLVPSTQVVEAFTTIAKVNYDKITDNVKQIESLIETRDYLLPKLISGEVSLGEGSHG